MNHTDVMNASTAILDEVERSIVGKRSVLELILTAMLADGHVLLEDVPGVAKTAIARAFAEAAGLSFSRVQFTPDLIPADITGAAVLTSLESEAEFKPGPVFANMVLADEINRAPPKTQSSLLEAMEERQVTSDGVTHPLPQPFLVVGTQNPIEQEGTYPLPEAQLDRFLIRTDIGYPGTSAEVAMVLNRARRQTERLALSPVLRHGELGHLQQRVEEVHISDAVAHYVVNVVEATRSSVRTEAGASPRGSLGLLKAARARAAISGRSFVLPDDIKALAVPVLAHRIILHPDQWVRGVQAPQVIAEVLHQVPAPVGADDPTQGSALAAPPPGHHQPAQPAHQPPPQANYQAPNTMQAPPPQGPPPAPR